MRLMSSTASPVSSEQVRSKRRVVVTVLCCFTTVLLIAVGGFAVRAGQAERSGSPLGVLESSDPTALLRSPDADERAAAQLALFYQARTLAPAQIDAIIEAACDMECRSGDEAAALGTVLAKAEPSHTTARVERVKSELASGKRKAANSYLPLIWKYYEDRRPRN